MKKPTDFIMGNKVYGSWVILFFVFIIKKEGKVKAREELTLKLWNNTKMELKNQQSKTHDVSN